MTFRERLMEILREEGLLLEPALVDKIVDAHFDRLVFMARVAPHTEVRGPVRA